MKPIKLPVRSNLTITDDADGMISVRQKDPHRYIGAIWIKLILSTGHFVVHCNTVSGSSEDTRLMLSIVTEIENKLTQGQSESL